MSFDDGIRAALAEELAHGVRSALAVTSASLELLRDGSHPIRDEGAVLSTAGRNLAAARRTCERLVKLASWPCHPRSGDVPVGVMIHKIVSAARADASARDLAIDVSVADGAMMVGDQDVLQFALECVIDGAITGADAPGAVSIDLATDPDSGRATLSIAPGPTSSPSSTPYRTAMQLLAEQGVVVRSPGEAPTAGDTVPAVTLGHAEHSGARVSETSALQSEPRSPTGEPTPNDEGPLVLIVEDDDELRGLMERALSIDHRVVATASAEEAYRAAVELHPDAVVCDIVLPDTSGEHLVHRLRGDDLTAGVPIVVVTGRSDDDLRVRLLREGANDYVTKPFIVAELRARIDNLIANRLDVADLKLKADEAQRVAMQLQHAFDSRIVIEQAKAFLAADRDTDLDAAFESLRSYARSNRLKIRDVAERVVHDGFRW
jgi:DNA-binding response OmpR family regulator